MKNLVIILIIITGSDLFGQYARIKDMDGYTNVRLSPNSNSEVIYKLVENEIFLFSIREIDSGWVKVEIPVNKYALGCPNNEFLEGYIHSSRLDPIHKSETYKGDEFQFSYSIIQFSKDNMIIEYMKLPSDSEYRGVTRINGRYPYGFELGSPIEALKTQIGSVNVEINGRKIRVAKTVYGDLFNISQKKKVYKNGTGYIVQQEFGNAASYFELVWVFSETELVQRIIFIP